MQYQHAAGLQQCRLPAGLQPRSWQPTPSRHTRCHTQQQCLSHQGYLQHAQGSTRPASKHSARRRQPLRHVATAAAAAADMGGLRLPDVGVGAHIRTLLQPSKYDAELLSLAVPALAAMALEPLMNMFSAAVLGHLGTQQLGAVSLASLATSLATYVFSFLVFLTTPRIAAAHANGETQQVARLAAVGLWLAAVSGVFVAVGMNASAGAIVAAMKPPEANVATYAVQYITVRSWGIMAAMLGFVASGTYRGVKDTRTPLLAALGAALTHVVLTPLFILGLNWGVWGAALSATISQWVSCILLVSMMFKRQLLGLKDLMLPPQWHEVVPYLWKGAVLAFRMIITFGMIMFASGICVRAGAASQAAFEIIRQVWIISIQLFESLNVATQAMAAGFLGKDDRTSARQVLERAFNVSCAVGLAIGLLLFIFKGGVVHLFTKDAAVASLAGAILPIIAFFMPLDAGASIMDGGLIAAGQTNTLSVIQMLGSVVQYGVMAYLVANSLMNVVSVWAVLKILTLARLGGGYWLHFVSVRSAFRPRGVGDLSQPAQAHSVVPVTAVDFGSSLTSSCSIDEDDIADVVQAIANNGAKGAVGVGSESSSTTVVNEHRSESSSNAGNGSDNNSMEQHESDSHGRIAAPSVHASASQDHITSV